MKCEICGKEAPYFTETYDPAEKKARTIYLCEEHQEKLYKRIVDCMLDMGSSHITESEESSVMQRRMRYNYRPQWSGYDCCMNCMHLFFVGPHGLTCNVIGGRVYKGDTCSAFKRRGYVINEGTPDEKILERVKEAMGDKPMPFVDSSLSDAVEAILAKYELIAREFLDLQKCIVKDLLDELEKITEGEE